MNYRSRCGSRLASYSASSLAVTTVIWSHAVSNETLYVFGVFIIPAIPDVETALLRCTYGFFIRRSTALAALSIEHSVESTLVSRQATAPIIAIFSYNPTGQNVLNYGLGRPNYGDVNYRTGLVISAMQQTVPAKESRSLSRSCMGSGRHLLAASALTTSYVGRCFSGMKAGQRLISLFFIGVVSRWS